MSSTLAAAHGATTRIAYWRKYPPTINSAAETDQAIAAAVAVAGAAAVQVDCQPAMASEDFAFMLLAKPGAYIWIGADGHEACPPLHNPHYDFNDGTLALGAAYWVALANTILARR
jgi:hippurate hydrolase